MLDDQGKAAQASQRPSTAIGKRRSNRNAVKHGILTKALIVRGESVQEYDSLLQGLLEDFQPQGEFENVLVEKLATILWRMRRLLAAEGAEIQKKTEIMKWDRQEQKEKANEEIFGSVLEMLSRDDGLMSRLQESYALKQCIDLLIELRGGILADGFDIERDAAIITRVYGEIDHPNESVRRCFWAWVESVEASEKDRRQKSYATPEISRKKFFEALDDEIRRLKACERERVKIENEQSKLEILRRMVPDSPGMDRLLRYETTLERSFDRTLGQLERAQRLRRGQPVAPRIDVSVSP